MHKCIIPVKRSTFAVEGVFEDYRAGKTKKVWEHCSFKKMNFETLFMH